MFSRDFLTKPRVPSLDKSKGWRHSQDGPNPTIPPSSATGHKLHSMVAPGRLAATSASATFCSRSFHQFVVTSLRRFSGRTDAHRATPSRRPQKFPRSRRTKKLRMPLRRSQLLFGKFAKRVEAIAALCRRHSRSPNVPCLSWCPGGALHHQVERQFQLEIPVIPGGATPRSPRARWSSRSGDPRARRAPAAPRPRRGSRLRRSARRV
jgi:hypothetical protein